MTTITPLAIDHIVLRTAQLSAMVTFYCDVLGCTVERKTAADTGLTQLRAGSALIDLVSVDSKLGKMGGAAPGASGNNLDHFCLQIAPLEQSDIIAALKYAGIEVDEFQTRYGAQGYGESVYLRDPDGNQVELRCRPMEEDA